MSMCGYMRAQMTESNVPGRKMLKGGVKKDCVVRVREAGQKGACHGVTGMSDCAFSEDVSIRHVCNWALYPAGLVMLSQ